MHLRHSPDLRAVAAIALLAALLPSVSPAQGWHTRHKIATTALVFTATTLALMPADVELVEEMREPANLRSPVLRRTADAFNYAGGPGGVIASVTTLGLGLARHDTTWTMVGLRASEALSIGSTATALLKGAFGRQRPFVDVHNSRVWYLGRGFAGAGRSSFPSGHATAAFALATAVSRELRIRTPRATRVATPLLYGSAVLVAAARMYGAHHWASDVVAGAGVGTLSGYLVTRHDAEVGMRGVHIGF